LTVVENILILFVRSSTLRYVKGRNREVVDGADMRNSQIVDAELRASEIVGRKMRGCWIVDGRRMGW
jgi:hypothetical protein